MTDVAVNEPVNAARPETKEQRAWYWYDWANSAYVTTTATVLMGPYLTHVATQSVCPGIEDDTACTTNLDVLGIPISPGSVYAYTVTLATIVSALFLVLIGAVADRSPRPTRLFAGFAWAGALAASLMFFIAGTNWQLGVVLTVVASLCLGASLVIYDSILNRIANENERDRVSSKGWALGYLGGGLLLAINFAMLTFKEQLGLDTVMATRISLLMAGLWWAGFTIIPVRGLAHLTGTVGTPVDRKAGVVGGSFKQLATTFRELRLYPQTMLFLLAYLFFNDGIQTVIGNSSLYGQKELGFAQRRCSACSSSSSSSRSSVLGSSVPPPPESAPGGRCCAGIALWSVVVIIAFFVPAQAIALFFALGVLIGIVLGGTQALSRSLYSQLIPRGKEAEFFGFYQAMERGTSWLGTLAFGLVYQFTHSYRWAIVALIFFFVVGGLLLAKVDMRRGIEEAGNPVPVVV